ncbi:bifunctional Winged helix DNA-binding domain superfamily/Rad21-Rec8-like protein [Babesia duncani]|uniref:Bifunctional Winged helix DNA-binding domain superfamily/Rad21-Rec8-like protein n=1 Tax=Babesia duncani TaxID=323732 RepID=A0AAD9PP12_9APIC|nr:bifunctional Winged helix DNA-binding domain superfamily/Rad21-Rec8-like protein [Babesia duncani]
MCTELSVYTPARRQETFISPPDINVNYSAALNSAIESISTLVMSNHDGESEKLSISDSRRKNTTLACSSMVCVGLTSALFKPLLIAAFNSRRLTQKLVLCIIILFRMILACDLERLCVALLHAIKMEQRPFPLIGFQVAGMCCILSQKLKLLETDVQSFSRRLFIITRQPQERKDKCNYFEAPGERYRASSKRRKSKTKKKTLPVSSGQLTLENVVADCDFTMPIERMEMMQMMNFGIGMGMSTELVFYKQPSISTESGDSISKYGSPPMLSIENLNLTSPFRLNAYSFGFDDAATTVATSDFTFDSEDVANFTPDFLRRYDMDWNLYNDPINEEYDEGIVDFGEPELNETSESKQNRLVLLDKKNGKNVHMVKGTRIYDSKLVKTCTPHTKRVKRPRLSSNQMDLPTMFASPSPPMDRESLACPKSTFLSGAIESLYKEYFTRDTIDTHLVRDSADTNRQYSRDSSGTTPQGSRAHAFLAKTSEAVGEWERPLESPMHVGSKITNQSVLEGFRDLVRQISHGPVSLKFSSVTSGHTAESVSMIFYRSLVLANCRFISMEQSSGFDDIILAPGKRFWEPLGRDSVGTL